jgi:hypothetical protein
MPGRTMFHVKPCMRSLCWQAQHAGSLLRLFGAVLLFGWMGEAHAVYRCTSPDGRTTFSDTACPVDQKGGQVQIKPVRGVGVSPNPVPSPPISPPASGLGNASGSSSEAMQRRNAEYEALFTPECRRARAAFMNKANQPGGMDELMQEGNRISKAWAACEFEAKDAIAKLNAQDRERVAAENKQQREQELAQQRKAECDTKRQVLQRRQAQSAKPSEQDKEAIKVLEREVAASCR